MSSWVGLEWSSIIFGEKGIIQEMPNACQYSSLLSTVTYLEWTSALSRERQRYNLQYQNGAPGSAFWPLFGITDHAGCSELRLGRLRSTVQLTFQLSSTSTAQF